MPRNVEIKAFCSDLAKLKVRAAKLANDDKGVIIKQRDVFFNVEKVFLNHLFNLKN